MLYSQQEHCLQMSQSPTPLSSCAPSFLYPHLHVNPSRQLFLSLSLSFAILDSLTHSHPVLIPCLPWLIQLTVFILWPASQISWLLPAACISPFSNSYHCVEPRMNTTANTFYFQHPSLLESYLFTTLQRSKLIAYCKSMLHNSTKKKGDRLIPDCRRGICEPWENNMLVLFKSGITDVIA